MSVSYWHEPGPFDRPPTRAQVVVVGAGVLGAYLAYRLGESGRQVVVVEGRHAAAGASGRNAGMVLSGVAESYARAVERYGRADARSLWSLTLRNRETMTTLVQRLKVPSAWSGSLTLALDEREAEDLRLAAALLAEDGFEGRLCEGDPLSRGFAAALQTSGDFVIHPVELVRALLRASRAQLVEGREVYALQSQADGVLVRAAGIDLLAQSVILATNAYTPLLEPALAGLIVPQRGQLLITGPNPPLLGPACYASEGFIYFRQLDDGRFLLGGCRNHCFEEEQTYVDTTTPTVQGALEAFRARYFPDVEAPVERRWSGTMGFTADGLPLVGRLRRDERISLVAGFNGHGLGLGFMAAEELLATLRGAAPGPFAASRLTDAVL